MNLPDTILLDIFSYIPLPERWLVASVCKQWYGICHDPYLYRHVQLDNLEYRTLVLALHTLVGVASRIKSITISGCYSRFIQDTIVPVHFSNRAHNTGPMLFSHLTALQPYRRRDEYLKHHFELHDEFSDVFTQLLCNNATTLTSLTVQNCSLDLEMTELFCSIACHAHALESFTYKDNHDRGIHSSGLLQAIVTACPRMRHFHGSHSGMDDAVLLTISRHWVSLESLTLCSLKSRDVLSHAEIISDGRQLTGSSPTGRISGHALWQLLEKCQKLVCLELYDLACISNRELAVFNTLKAMAMQENERQQQQQTSQGTAASVKRFTPYAIPKSIFANKRYNAASRVIPGSSIRQLIITKYMTTPLSKPGFESLLKLFPKLNRLEYETNFHTFDNMFEGITRDMFDAECLAVEEWCDERKGQLEYVGRWHTDMTAEQRLMAGMASVSEGA
ncbi:uncharacterized protein ATC70_009013 [Mucor velutinosus]|uniref:F-box domain-containing protein n=1 Tax=Mucor velutinosus TaxID=708070 RepID=A0AAN7DQ06_9FUNG|nr:hypothetical protein ATC70_009013 [Mucor velutinosus]